MPENRSPRTALAVASLAISLIKSDKGLIRRLRKLAKAEKAPFDPDNLDRRVLDMCEQAILLLAARDTVRPPAEPDLAVPVFGKGGLATSAAVLAIASFAVEYLHAVPGVREAFITWLNDAHPSAGADPASDISQERLKAADQMITLMAHAADKMAGHA